MSCPFDHPDCRYLDVNHAKDLGLQCWLFFGDTCKCWHFFDDTCKEGEMYKPHLRNRASAKNGGGRKE